MGTRKQIRSSLPYAPYHGALPIIIGWPFAWIRFSDEVIEFSSGHLVPFNTLTGGRAYFRVGRSSITKIVRRKHGIRIFGSGFDDPWVVAAPFSHKFIRKLRENGLDIPDGPIIRTNWWYEV